MEVSESKWFTGDTKLTIRDQDGLRREENKYLTLTSDTNSDI